MTADENLAKYGCMLYDCEIVNMIPMPMETLDSNLRYCTGWEDFAHMGISVVTAYDFVLRQYRVFLGDNLDKLQQLIDNRDIIISFNGDRFDSKLLAANDIIVPKKKSYDMWKAFVSTQKPGQKKGFALNNMLKANGLREKSGHGGDAPKLAQQGKWGELIEYCLDDTGLSVQLERLACNDVLKNPKTGSYMKVPMPWDIVKTDAAQPLF